MYLLCVSATDAGQLFLSLSFHSSPCTFQAWSVCVVGAIVSAVGAFKRIFANLSVLDKRQM